MMGVFIAIAVLVYSTCVEQGSSRFQHQTRTETWLSPSAHVVSAIQERLRLRCVYIINNRRVAFGKFICVFLVIKEEVQMKILCCFFLDSNEQQMILQFWKFLSLREKQAVFSGPEVLDGKPLCRYSVPLNVILSADKSTIRWTQEVTTTLMPSLFSEIFGTWHADFIPK
jgi:hypothetical protein